MIRTLEVTHDQVPDPLRAAFVTESTSMGSQRSFVHNTRRLPRFHGRHSGRTASKTPGHLYTNHGVTLHNFGKMTPNPLIT